ncbi:MAG: glycogen debranching protein GlgX, partial [Planctomycetaceae bacterium]
GEPSTLGEFASRITGSSDLYQEDGRHPIASINFVVAHDGFTLRDLVSYNDKHNQANGEGNRDGSDDNISWNCGAEGPTDDPDIVDLRERKKRCFLATLMFSQGVPMLLAGDEMGHTQDGNNNAYCQDNEITWIDWDLSERQEQLLKFTRRIIAIWQAEPVLRRRRFFHGLPIGGEAAADIAWLNPDGKEMSDEDWNEAFVRCLGVALFGDSIDVDERGEEIGGDTLLMLFNADHGEELPFTLPELEEQQPWILMLDTARLDALEAEFDAGQRYPLKSVSVALFRLRSEREDATV